MAIGGTQNMYRISLVSQWSSQPWIFSVGLLYKYKYFPTLHTSSVHIFLKIKILACIFSSCEESVIEGPVHHHGCFLEIFSKVIIYVEFSTLEFFLSVYIWGLFCVTEVKITLLILFYFLIIYLCILQYFITE